MLSSVSRHTRVEEAGLHAVQAQGDVTAGVHTQLSSFCMLHIEHLQGRCFSRASMAQQGDEQPCKQFLRLGAHVDGAPRKACLLR